VPFDKMLPTDFMDCVVFMFLILAKHRSQPRV
jgi:hypothetical protein